MKELVTSFEKMILEFEKEKEIASMNPKLLNKLLIPKPVPLLEIISVPKVRY